MPKLKNMFIKGKMNLDLDERLVPKGEYRKAQNILITNSEDSDVGAIENARGHERIISGSLNLGEGILDDGQCIGSYTDVSKERIFWFITNFTSNNSNTSINNIDRASGASNENCRIVMRESDGQEFYLATGVFLNFSTTHHITGVNVVGNYLYWTDNYNQPRYIDIELGKSDSTYYDCEEKISVAKVAPFLPPFLHKSNEAASNANLGDTYTLVTTNPSNSTEHTKSEYMQEKFIRFAYRYKYQDNTYSIISPFTQHVFKPLNSGNIEFATTGKSDAPEPIVNVSSAYMYQHNEAPIMKNAYDKVVMRIPIPTVNSNGIVTEFEQTANNISSNSYTNELKIDSIEILLREAGTSSIKIVDTIDMVNTTGLTFARYKTKPKQAGHYYRQTVEYTYLARDPFKVLPEKQLIRVGDNAPVRAKAQEIAGNRLIYGNITLGYDLPRDEENKKGIKFIVTSGAKGENEVGYDVDDIGHYFHNREQYKYHNIKQRRTYQVGIVLIDRYGRTSPVIPSTYKVDNLSDTHTVDAVVEDFKNKYNSNTYSWSSQHLSYGQALSIEFKDKYIVESSKTHSSDRPNGWYAWRVVVKQTEQDYYNIYTQHPMVNWSLEESTKTDHPNNHADDTDQVVKGTFSTTEASRSWFSLTNDNINKVPRSIKDVDRSADFGETDDFGKLINTTRDGISGSEVKLYPKVIQIDNANTAGQNASNWYDSTMGHIDQDYINVLSIGSAIDQGLSSISNAKKGDVSGNSPATFFVDRIRPYSFLADNHKNPVVAEIPNLYLEPVAVKGEFATNGSDVIRSSDNINSDMPFGYPNSKRKGLTVFETKPVESKLDIYWETSSCGLVRDLNEHCDYASNGPTNIQITPTHKTNTYTAGTLGNIPEEVALSTQIGEITATPYNDGSNPTITNFTLLQVTNGVDDGNDLGKFTIDLEDDRTYVKISAACNDASAANAVNLTSSGTLTRFRHDEIEALSKQTGSFQFFNTNFGTAAKFFKIWFWDNSGSNINTKRQIVVEVNASKVAQGYTNEQASASGNIGVKWMLKTNDLFAFYNNDSNDLYNLKIRAVQSNNVTGSGNIEVSITNSTPSANNPGGVIIPSNTLPFPGGRNLATLVGVNGSADTSNNNFGMTASLSGTDASSFQLSSLSTDGQWKLGASDTFDFDDLFGTPVNGNYSGSVSLSWNVTDNGNLTPAIATTITLTPVQVVNVTGYHDTNETTACNNAQTQANTVYYAIKHDGTSVPTSQQLYVGNKIYTNSKLTTTLSAGYIVVHNGSNVPIPYTVNSDGKITAVNDACEIV